VFAKIAVAADGLDKQLEDLSKRVAEPEVDLKDAAFTQGMIRCAQRIDKLTAKMAEPGVNLEDTKFQAEIFKINAQLDRLDSRHVTAEIKVDVDRSALSRIGGLFGAGGRGIGGLLGGIGGGIGATGSAIGGVGSAIGQYGQAAGIAALIAAAIGAGPALLPAGLGLGVGGLAAFGAIAVGAKDRAKLLALQKSLAGVTGTTASSQARRTMLQNQIAAFQQGHGPQLAFGAAAADVGRAAQGTFFGALTDQPVTMGPGGPVRGQSFLQGLLPIFSQVERFIKAIRPELADLFRASLPYLGMFVKFLEQTAKVLLPVFTNMLRQMQPYLPLIGKGLLEIVKGFAGFLQAIGPSAMQASAKIFVALTIGMAWALKGLGIAINWLVENVPVWVHDIAKWWDWLRHDIVNNLDGVRHDLAHWWDTAFQNSIGMLIRFAHNVETQFNSIRHGIASAFDAVRHTFASFGHDIATTFDAVRHFQGQFDAFGKDIGVVRHVILAAFDDIRHGGAIAFDALRHLLATAWDAMWHNTLATLDSLRHGIAAAWDNIWKTSNSQAQTGVTGIVGWFRALPGRALAALFGFGHELYAFGHAAWNDFWSGMKAVAGSLLSWVGNFVKDIWDKVSKFFGFGSPSRLMYNAGKNIVLGMEKGIRDHAHRAVSAAQAVAHQVGNAGGGVQRWAPLVRKALAMEGLSSGLLGNVLFQMQTESGGNPNAINLNDINAQMGDPSRGLMQTIMSTFQSYHWPGTSNNIYDPLANIAAALNYARHVYGPSLMSGGMGIGSGHGYDTGGWLPTGVSLAWNNTGRPERVLGPGEGGNITINVNVSPLASPADTGRKIAEVLGLYKKSGGMIYRPGGF
jgi:hypothetical protein